MGRKRNVTTSAHLMFKQLKNIEDVKFLVVSDSIFYWGGSSNYLRWRKETIDVLSMNHEPHLIVFKNAQAQKRHFILRINKKKLSPETARTLVCCGLRTLRYYLVAALVADLHWNGMYENHKLNILVSYIWLNIHAPCSPKSKNIQ